MFMMPMHPPGKPHAESYDVDLETLTLADELGYDEAWIGEHFTSAWENVPAPDLLIAAALQRTKRMRLGTGVACLPNHNPAVLAHRIAQLDQMAKGRFNFGIGSGGFPGDFELFGVDPAAGQHRTITRDVIDLVLQIWDEACRGEGNGLHSETEHWQFTLPGRTAWGQGVHMVPYQRPHPPIAVAGLNAKSDTLVMAGERGWIPMSINFVPVPTLRTHWQATEEGAARMGRDANRRDWRIARDIYVADTTEQARAEALAGTQARVFRDYFFPLVRSVGQMSLFKLDPSMPDDDVTAEWLIDNVWIVGGPDEVARRLRELHQDVGGFGGVLQLVYDWGEEQAKNFHSMELLAHDVLPQLADLN
jgi:alkanesulfonate monooxygenase SsuD/methylene tetrahydromethanopterin reductase-like flavin-dependent oxidoreductase (luciferase family)